MNLYTNNLPIDRYVERLLGPDVARLLQDGKTQEIRRCGCSQRSTMFGSIRTPPS